MTLESQDWFAAVSDVFADVQGINRVYGVKGGETDPKVVPMSSELASGDIGVLGYAGGEITPGSWERQRHELNAAIWVPAPATAIGAAYVDRVLTAFPARSKAGLPPELPHPELASVLVTRFDAIDSREWGEAQARKQYVVLPFTIEVVRNRAAAYIAA
jgi:hypothetical protein